MCLNLQGCSLLLLWKYNPATWKKSRILDYMEKTLAFNLDKKCAMFVKIYATGRKDF